MCQGGQSHSWRGARRPECSGRLPPDLPRERDIFFRNWRRCQWGLFVTAAQHTLTDTPCSCGAQTTAASDWKPSHRWSRKGQCQSGTWPTEAGHTAQTGPCRLCLSCRISQGAFNIRPEEKQSGPQNLLMPPGRINNGNWKSGTLSGSSKTAEWLPHEPGPGRMLPGSRKGLGGGHAGDP